MGFSIGGLTGSNSSAKKAAQLSFAYQKQILQNQHQWEMQDLEKAGLNPALTLGDSAVSGSHASAPMPNMGGGQDALGGLINSAVSMYSAKKNAETGDTQGQLNLAQAGKTIAETKGIPQQIKNDTLRTIALQSQAESTKALVPSQIELNKKNSAKTNADRLKIEEDILSSIHNRKRGKLGQWIGDDPLSNLTNVSDSIVKEIMNMHPTKYNAKKRRGY